MKITSLLRKAIIPMNLCLVMFYLNRAQGQTEIWDMTNLGGNGSGVIFKTDSNGDNQTVEYMFGDNPGINPQYTRLCEAANGKLYGMTSGGGATGSGVLFEFDPDAGTYTKILDFGSADRGSSPQGRLIEATTGILYGMTSSGGTSGYGVLFEYDYTTSTFTKKLDFDGSATGRNPYGGLVLASNGMLYGMTRIGGTSNLGVLFEYDFGTSTYTKKFDFDGAANGSNPFGNLVESTVTGKLYGMTRIGGANSLGVLFEYDYSSDIFTNKFDFDGATLGGSPYGSLVEADNGKLYGLTYSGGSYNYGVLIEYDPSNDNYSSIFEFDGTSSGSNPYGSLTLASNGMLYGMTFQGGANNYGVLFEYDITSSSFTIKVDFDGSNKGRNPKGSLIQSSDQLLYGMTLSGGSSNSGVLFEYNPATSTYAKKQDLNIFPNGKSPYGSLVQAYNGKYYGMTYTGGANSLGVLFEYDPLASTYTKKLDFSGTTNGSNPYGSLIQATNGNLYGLTYSGGTNGTGILFEYNPATSTFTKKVNFDGTSYGSNPFGSLVQATNGKLYGTTFQGGTSNKGVLFEYDPVTSTLTKKLDFSGTANGSNPYGRLVQASNGKLYGMTNLGGTGNKGVLFEYDPASSTYTKKVDFTGTTNGSNPYGSLIEAANGKLYGMTFSGGSSNWGVLFEFNFTSSTYTKKLDFTGTNGRNPYGSLNLAPNGNLYGTTYQGGANALGVLFEYDPATNTYTKKLDFDGFNGSKPYYSRMTVVSNTTWTGAIDNDWNDQDNWTSGVPDEFSLAIIPVVTNQPHVTADIATPAKCKHLTINTGSSVTVDAGKALTVYGVLTNNTGNLGVKIESDGSGTGSLINNTPGVDARVERYLTHSKWHFIGMPVETGVAGVFHLSSGHSDIYLRTHVESTNTWGEYIVPVETPLIQGRGYECWVGDPLGFAQDETIVFPGKLNSGNYSTGTGDFYPLEYTSGHGLNLICNPYPSALQANIHTWTKTNIANSVWTWDPDAGNYLYWNGTGGGGGGYGTLTDGVIPSMQAFFVLATGSGPVLTLPQFDQLHSNQNFYKDSGMPENTIRIDVEGNNYHDAIFISFNEKASEDYDVDYDVEKIYGIDEAPQMFALNGDKKLSIDALPEIGENRKVFIGFECLVQSDFSVSASGMDGFDSNTEFYLEDLKEGVFHNLKDNPTYSFTNSLTDNPDRFILHFDSPNSVDEQRIERVQIYSYNNLINIRNQSHDKMQVFVYDLVGRQILADEYYSSGLIRISTQVEMGYYVVKVLSGGEVTQKKVFLR